jgi:hypothetical protein
LGFEQLAAVFGESIDAIGEQGCQQVVARAEVTPTVRNASSAAASSRSLLRRASARRGMALAVVNLRRPQYRS